MSPRRPAGSSWSGTTCATWWRQFACHATLRRIKQNLFWAFIYNTVGIPVAALGYLSPIIAAAAMALSSLSVIVNSALLKRVRVAV